MDKPVEARESPTSGKALTRSLQVADRLRESILSGEIPPGERVNEVQLSQRLGVSRTPTRAALHALAAEGLLDYETNRGFTVREYSPQNVSEGYEIRAVLEGLACRLAATRPPDASVTALFEDALALGDEVVAGFDGTTAQMEAYRQSNVLFHTAVIKAADNQMLEDTLRLALARPATSLRNIVSFSENPVRRRHDDHHRIYDAIRAGDGWRAELLMREHVTSVKYNELERRPGRS
jgi:GntR family transcriptional regulator of vanillate catabolism